jgi:hypothetical protein
MSEEGTKRTVHDTSFDDQQATKSQKTQEEDDTPSWAKSLLQGQNELRACYSSLSNDYKELNVSMQRLEIDQRRQSEEVEHLDERVTSQDQRLEHLEGAVMELQVANAKLQGENLAIRAENKQTRADLDDQTDRGLRDQVTIYGLPRDDREKYWNSTIVIIAEWLAANSAKPQKYWDKAIVRAHRGPAKSDKPGPAPIHCIFRWRVTEEVRDLFVKAGNKIGTVTIKDKFCKNTQERVNNALVYRRGLLNNNHELKIKVTYPAKVMVKAPGENRYSFEKAF